jgi:signal transduction histidine kinase
MRINLNLKYVVTITFVLCIVTGLTFELILQKHEQMITSQVDMQAKALFKQVVITRRWVAEHGGVFIEKLPWMEPNPYLRNATITDATGKRYVRENPAMVTKQLSQYAEHEQLYIFHITSLKLMNPENAPDAFETKALKAFESKQEVEASTIDKMGSSSYYYRYIAPLYVEKACLECHGHQGYKVGDVRGAISVSIPMDYARSMIALERRYMLAGAFFIAVYLIATLYLANRRMVIGPIRDLQNRMLTFSRTGTPDLHPLPTGDEIGDLSRTFDDMARELHEYHGSLQDKVRAATRELTEKNESLARASRSKSDFIAQTSHELRTPLTAIKGAMDYLSVKLSQRGTGDDQDLQMFFEMIKKNADRLIRLVNNVLDYERIELGTIEMNFTPVNLKHVFQEVIIQCTPLAEQQQVCIHLQAEDVTAVVDEDRMKQVLTNLLSNALAFSPTPATIRIMLQCQDEQVIASVEDEGPGVSEHDREKIFRQFYTKDVKDGTGLGLAICRGIIDAHDGSIGLESSPQGGSRFWFTIPRGKKDHGGQEKKTAGDR